MSEPSRRLWLWVHGPAHAPAGSLIGWQDPPLLDASDESRRVRALAGLIEGPAQVHSSDRRRARQAARPLARALGARLEVTAALREIDYGRWSGLTWAEVRRREPEAYAEYMANWHDTAMPGGESQSDLQARVSRWWSRIRPMGDVVVVGHLGSVRALAADILGWGPEDALGVALARGHYAVLDLDGRAGPGWNLPLLD